MGAAAALHPYCSETLMENHCMWNARGNSEWAMLSHAPDCFINDSSGATLLIDLLDSLDENVSSLLLPTFIFEQPDATAVIFPDLTAADIFETFVIRRCAMLLASRHMPIFDPHDVSVALVHEELTAIGGRQYTAALAVHHYFQLFSSRGSDNLEWGVSSGHKEPYCKDRSMSRIGKVILGLLQSVKT
jgi:hypothetical protein